MADGETEVEVGLLGDYAHAGLDFVGARDGVESEDTNFAGGRQELGRDLTDECGLAGSVWAEDGQELAAFDGQGDVAIGPGPAAVALIEVSHFDCCWQHVPQSEDWERFCTGMGQLHLNRVEKWVR